MSPTTRKEKTQEIRRGRADSLQKNLTTIRNSGLVPQEVIKEDISLSFSWHGCQEGTRQTTFIKSRADTHMDYYISEEEDGTILETADMNGS